MTERLSKLHSALICGATFIGAVMLLVKGLPVVGNFFFLVLFFGSPLVWFQTFCCSLSMLYFPNSPTFVWQVANFMRHPALSWGLWAGPFLVYGVAEGFMRPLKSEGVVNIVKSVAIRFLLTLLAVGLIGICLGIYAMAHDS
jgi:hypothetical protein